ncbi:hypothetical protein [Microbacterium terregens]|uniref:Glycosyltransferase RgtA/B/C/D-like domain-containing protein n=1 Tax=Microbacterium terregens TaxID=69363 RepID=A0ABV5T1M4_9MICO
MAAFLIAGIHGTAPEFVYDAAQYWGGAVALVAGESPVLPGSLPTRGVLTTLVYLVPALVTAAIGPSSTVWTVLVWNAAVGAVVAAVLLPRLAGVFSSDPSAPPPALRVWVSALLGGFLISGFAPFPLVDISSVALALAGFYGLVAGRRWWAFCLAGLALTAAVNLRPGMIAPILLAIGVLLIAHPRAVALAVPGVLVGFLPQVMLNVRVWAQWSPVPPETIPLSSVQAGPAPYTLRYDTVAFADQRPQQWYCDPAYAAQLVSDPVSHNQFGVVASAFQHLPDSLWFMTRKAAANLHWSFATPYENSPGEGSLVMALLVIAVSAFGVVALVRAAIRARSDRRRLVTTLAMIGFWSGALGTLIFSTPETRFALPLVLVGLIGVVATVPATARFSAPSRGTVVAVACGLVLTVALFLAGVEALTHALPPGPVIDAADCATR